MRADVIATPFSSVTVTASICPATLSATLCLGETLSEGEGDEGVCRARDGLGNNADSANKSAHFTDARRPCMV
jgi:hypothetical protein